MNKTSSTSPEIEVVTVDSNDPVAPQVIAAQEAVLSALRQHKLAGNPVAAWRDGKVVMVQPDEIDA